MTTSTDTGRDRAPYDAPMSGTAHDDDPYLTLYEISELFGWAKDTARAQHQRAEYNRRNNVVRPGDMDPPERHIGRSPVWRKSAILEWKERRPGPGRPKNDP